MRKVIAAKKRADLHNHDFYSYDKYQKITLAANDVKPDDLKKGLLGKIPGPIDQVSLAHTTTN